MPAIFYLVYKAIFLQGETLLAFIDCGFISFGFEYLSYNRIRFPMKMKAIRNFGLQVLLIPINTADPSVWIRDPDNYQDWIRSPLNEGG